MADNLRVRIVVVALVLQGKLVTADRAVLGYQQQATMVFREMARLLPTATKDNRWRGAVHRQLVVVSAALAAWTAFEKLAALD